MEYNCAATAFFAGAAAVPVDGTAQTALAATQPDSPRKPFLVMFILLLLQTCVCGSISSMLSLVKS
jgi:hypothetical protein